MVLAASLMSLARKIVLDTGFGILEADPAWRDRAVARLGAGQLDGLVTGQALGFDHAATFGDSVAGIPSQPSHEESGGLEVRLLASSHILLSVG